MQNAHGSTTRVAIQRLSFACLSGPLVLALQVQARCLRPTCTGAKCMQAQPGAASTQLAAVVNLAFMKDKVDSNWKPYLES